VKLANEVQMHGALQLEALKTATRRSYVGGDAAGATLGYKQD